MSATAWVTVSRAADMLGMSERSIRRHIADGRLSAKLEGGRRLVKVDVTSGGPDMVGMTEADREALIRWLRDELKERGEQVGRLQEEIRASRERSDNIILRLTDELEAQRGLLEGRRSRGEEKRWLWRRKRGGRNGDVKQ